MIKATTCWLFCQPEEPRLWELCRNLDSLEGKACVLLLDFHSNSVLDFSPFYTWAAEMPKGHVSVQRGEARSDTGKPSGCVNVSLKTGN